MAVLPTKRIVSRAHLDHWIRSDTHQHVVDFISNLNSAVIGVTLSDPSIHTSEAVQAVLAILDEIEQLYHDTPPVDNGKSRFGNPAFRTFYDKLALRLDQLHRRLPNLDNSEYIPELGVYLQESWGNRTRVDYGSGMELNFLCWL